VNLNTSYYYHNKVICKPTPSFTRALSPSFSGIRQRKEILLYLSISCTRFESNYNSCTGGGSENLCSSSEGAQDKGKKLRLSPNSVEKLVWVPVISFCEISFPIMHLMPLLCRNWLFSPPNRQTLWITLMSMSDIISYEKSSLEKPKRKANGENSLNHNLLDIMEVWI
jgi:hypothetical protein